MGRDSQEFLSHVLSNIYINNDCDAVFVCGDFNARIVSLDEHKNLMTLIS